jgi:hypothetical protein
MAKIESGGILPCLRVLVSLGQALVSPCQTSQQY